MIKNIYKVMLLVAVVLATACQDDELIQQNNNPAAIGDEIVFGARAGFENSNADSRTVYTGEIYKEGNKTFERIDWVDGTDMIEIYCAEASNGPTGHYFINHWKDHDTNKDYAYLTRAGEAGLQWGKGKGDEGTHYFYAMYPSSQMFSTDQSTLAQGIKMDGTNLTGVIPGAQMPSNITLDGNGNYIAEPDMRYAYMAAKTSATRYDDENNQNGISMTFVPVVTAVQIELLLPENVSTGTGNVVPVSIAEVQVQGTGIAGNFTADLADWNETYPECKNVGEGVGSIQISTYVDGKPITLAAGKKLTFTVFLRPGADVSDLSVRISPNGAAYVGKSLTGEVIPQNLKTKITNLKLPAKGVDIDAAQWMSQLDETLELKKLSIPGTGGSFTYNYTNDSYRQQSVVALSDDEDVVDQWKLGIRAFEIASDRPRYGTTSLGEEYVKCNETSMGVRVYDVLTDLIDKVTDNPTETAVLILTYQPEGTVEGFLDVRERNATIYAQSLRVLYDGTTDGTTTSTTEYKLTPDQRKRLIQYKPNITLAEAKGNVMVFCRINQKDEEDGGSFSNASTILSGTNITLIDGCGTGKDRWGSRGYKVQGNPAYDAANIGDATKSVDYYLRTNRNTDFADWTSNVDVPIAANGDLNFGFGTNYDDITCWYQEWARVVHSDLIGSDNEYYFIEDQYYGWTRYDVRWYESYSEKLAAVQETFNMAISDKYSSYVFINSLCGYLVDSSISDSYTIFTGDNTGGIAGNIKALANKLNPVFYQYVLQSGMEQATGPTGIVMMDYVSATPTSDTDGSYYLPGVIIANNFKHGTGNSGSTGGGGNTGGDNTGGGNTGGGTDTGGPGGEDGEEEGM